MAIYHFSVSVISRSQGRSSVAASAYRSGEKLKDERTDLTHDYTKKSDVVNSEILLSKEAPAWMSEREKLWNAVELSEKRKDAQVAREITVALPRELSESQNWACLKTFVNHEFVDKGMVADVAFHRGHTGSEDQPHGHILLSLREVSKEGFGLKQRGWNDKALLKEWREHWASHCNRELAKAGFDIQVDHRTLEAQGINLEPQSKIGAKAASEQMARLAEHQALAERNGERLFNEPEIALTALTRQQSTFTHQDMARFVNRHTISKNQFDLVLLKVKQHPDLIEVGLDDQGRMRLTTQDMLALETKMLEQADKKSQMDWHAVKDASLAQGASNKNLSEEQASSLKHITQGADIACVVGFAGTGKSYMLGAAREAWEAEGFRVQGMTLSGIAAENLEGGSGIESFTVASRLWRWERGMERLTPEDIVVVDEAGMLGSRQMGAILEEASGAGAKVVLVGDPEQLQAIEAGAAFRAISEKLGVHEMSDIRRQHEPWQKNATKDLATERTREAIGAYDAHDNVHAFPTKDAAITGMIEQWDEVRGQSINKSQIMLAYTRAEVKSLNEQARLTRQASNELGPDVDVQTERGMRAFATGDRLYFLRNDNRDLKVKNGTLGTVEKIDERGMAVRLDAADGGKGSSRVVAFQFKDYNDIEHGYAATVYKAQGVTVDRAHVLASKYFDRHSTYVAMSRHREGADLYYARDEFPNFGAMTKSLAWEKPKDISLDYGAVRGLEVSESRQAQVYVRQMMSKGSDSPISTVLTEERLANAEKRLAQRKYIHAVEKDISVLEKEIGYSLSMTLEEGEIGTYRGLVEVAGRRYGVMEKENGEGRLIASEDLETRKKGESMMIEKQTNYRGREMLKAVQPEVREQERERSKGFDLDL